MPGEASPDVYENHSNIKYTREDQKITPYKLQPYGFNKYLSELIVKKYKEKFLILRPSMMLGTHLTKGPIYDILNHQELFVTLQTKLQIITTFAVAEIIKTLIKLNIVNEIINVGSITAFDFKNIKQYIDAEIKISSKAKTQLYKMNVNKLKKIYSKLKTSEEYLREFIDDKN